MPAAKRQKSTSPAVRELVVKISEAVLLLLVTCLPPQRASSFETTTLVGVIGVRARAPRAGCGCGLPRCSRAACPGNVLVREGEGVYRWRMPHHKTEKTTSIPDQVLDEAHGVEPVLLQLLEVLFTWSHALHLSAFGKDEASDRHFPFRSSEKGIAARSCADLRGSLRRAVQSAMDLASLPQFSATFNGMRCVERRVPLCVAVLLDIPRRVSDSLPRGVCPLRQPHVHRVVPRPGDDDQGGGGRSDGHGQLAQAVSVRVTLPFR